MMKSSFALLIVLMTLAILASPLMAQLESNSEDNNVVTSFKFLPMNPINLKTLIVSIDRIRAQVVAELEKEGKSSEKIALDSNVIACDLIKERLSAILGEASKPGVDADKLNINYVRTMRIWYSLEASILEDHMVKKNLIKSTLYLMKKAVHVIGKPFAVNIPSCDPDKIIDADDAAKEANRIYDGSGKAISKSEMASMTARQISMLEPSGETHVYRPLPIEPAMRYAELEKEIISLTRICPGGDPDFDMEQAKKVFMLDKVITSATSPKVATKDKYGFSWKFKWGNEVHTEALATRLYVALGGRYADLKYVLPPGAAPLVLHPEGDDESEYKTLGELVEKCNNNGIRSFKMMDWVIPEGLQKSPDGKLLGHGKVDEGFLKKYGIKKKYLGAWYVWFKESSVSFNAPCSKRLGAAAYSDLGAADSRSARGSIVFNTLLMNIDAKDANNKLVLLYNPQTRKFDNVIEYEYDLGCVLTAPVHEKLAAGEINEFDWKWMVGFPGHIGFNVSVLYHPDAWKKATFADAMWMARKICALDPSVFEWAAKESRWPEFAQSLFVERIKSRRNQLVEIFKLDKEGFKMLPVNTKLTIKVPQAGGIIDMPVRDGKIVSPDASMTVKNAEERMHPEGIFKTVSRFND